MKEKFNIDNYVNGIKIEELNCFDRAIAAAAGGFNYYYYYYYALICAVEYNWSKLDFWVPHNDLNRWTTRNNRILNNLGLCMSQHKYKNSEEMIEIIQSSIHARMPVLVLIPYFSIPWDERYLNMEQRRAVHIFLITEYDSANRTYIIRDDYMISQHNEDALRFLNPNFNQSLLWRYQIPEEYLISILDRSNEIGKMDNMYYANVLLTISSNDYEKETTHSTMIEYLHDFKYCIRESRLCEFVKNFNIEDELKHQLKYKRSKFGVFRRNHIGSIITISKVVNILLRDNTILENGDVFGIANEICEYRSKLLYKLQRNILKGQSLTEKEIFNIQGEICSFDNKLISFLKSIPK